MEPEGSLTRSRHSVTVTYPKPDIYSLHFSILFSKDPSNVILPSTTRSSEWSLSFSAKSYEDPSHSPLLTGT